MPERSKANKHPPSREAQQEKSIPNCRRSRLMVKCDMVSEATTKHGTAERIVRG